MATNPMQRKARNSFLLGMLVMLLISGIIIGLLFMQLMNKMKKEQEDKANSVIAYVLNQDVKAGQTVTDDDGYENNRSWFYLILCSSSCRRNPKTRD